MSNMNATQWSDQLRLPIIAAPMFLISHPGMVISCLENGIIGTFPSLNQRTAEGFEEWVLQTETARQKMSQNHAQPAPPYGVNLIVHKTNPRLQEDLRICIKYQVPLVITSLGIVEDVVEAVHSYGGKVFHDVTTRRHAYKAIEAGVDGLILVTAGAGGHAGRLNPIAFVREIRAMYDGAIALAGSITDGRDVATALQMGADFAYMGTRFIATEESQAPQAYKEMILSADIDDIIYTARVSGVPANFLKESLIKAGLTPEMWDKKGKMDFGDDSEAKAWKSIWSAGHGASGISKVTSIPHLINTLEEEFGIAVESHYERWSSRGSN